MALFLLVKPVSVLADSVRGKLLFTEKHCVLCHDIKLPGAEFRPIGPGLRGVGERHSRGWLSRWLANPAKVWRAGGPKVRDINRRYFEYRGSIARPRDSFMATVIGKKVHLTASEIKDLIDYLLTL